MNECVLPKFGRILRVHTAVASVQSLSTHTAGVMKLYCALLACPADLQTQCVQIITESGVIDSLLQLLDLACAEDGS